MNVELLPFTSATLSVAGGPATSVGTGTLTFPLRTDQPVVVATTRQGVARSYHFRCVPLDFPRLEVL
jgi:CRISPR/Cas system CMR subunit Cmr6 (Cas7 group RAMP superfamily)